MRRARRGRLPSLRLILILAALGALVLPGTLAGAILTLTQGRPSEGSVIRTLVAAREVPRSVRLDASGSLVLREGYASPAWLDLVVAGEEGRVVFSTMPSVPAGSSPGLAAIAAIAEGFVPRAAFFSDSVEIDGQRRGAWYAIVPSDAARSLAGETGPLFHLTGLAYLAGFALLFGLAVAGLLASQIGRLEKAAVAIASGDLETPVTARGAREIVELAEAMERMRGSIREDLARRARFLAAVSHDLRTPLTSIGGYLEAIEDGLAEDPATLARYVDIMKDRTSVLETRIGGLIELARMETGEWRKGFETRPLLPLFEGFARGAAEECALAGSAFASDLGALAGVEASVDGGLLARAFENLVSNALRHGKPGGRIAMAARTGGGREADLLFVDIDDEGPGIAEADRERAFEAFWRGPGAREGEGSGLGLHIARSIVRGHGWELVAASAPGGGGRMTLAIPRTPPATSGPREGYDARHA